MGRKKTTEGYKAELLEKRNGEYELCEGVKYDGAKTPIKHRHAVCGHVWPMRPGDLLYRHGCPECKKKNLSQSKAKTTEEYKAELKEVHNGEIELCEGVEYDGNKTKVKHRHVYCGHEWEAIPSSLLRGSGCPECKKKKLSQFNTKTTAEYKQKLLCKRAGEYVLCHGEEYVSAGTKIKHRHVVCGHAWAVRPRDLLSGYGCPKCKRSKGEEKVARFLDQQGIIYECEHPFDRCRNKNVLPFDFFLLNWRICIEYQGKQHYETTHNNFFGGEESLKSRQKNDQIKRDFCKKSGIILVEIPYNDERIAQRILGAIAQRKREREQNPIQEQMISRDWGSDWVFGEQASLF